MMWFKNKVLVIDPGKGTAVGYSVRTDRHIATLDPNAGGLHAFAQPKPRERHLSL